MSSSGGKFKCKQVFQELTSLYPCIADEPIPNIECIGLFFKKCRVLSTVSPIISQTGLSLDYVDLYPIKVLHEEYMHTLCYFLVKIYIQQKFCNGLNITEKQGNFIFFSNFLANYLFHSYSKDL